MTKLQVAVSIHPQMEADALIMPVALYITVYLSQPYILNNRLLSMGVR